MIMGTKERPRLSVARSLKHISAQLIDDTASITLIGVSDLDKGMKGTKMEKAIMVGKGLAAKAKEKNITKVVFDRGSFKYHGRIKALADAAREAGLDF